MHQRIVIKIFHGILFFAIVIALGNLMVRCANPIAPQGGPEDEDPPGIDSSQTTLNYQTNFEMQIIKFTFDEWVKLDDVFNQVVVSPPLEYRPIIELRKRSVLFEFDEREVLREKATYVINFGEAVKDLSADNVAEDLRFVFSTGDFIDSLTISGQLADAFTDEPVEDVLVMLYENLADTVVRTERPFYFAKTGEDGLFRINNIKEGTFKVFALEDANLNYRFDQETERIDFLEDPVSLSDTLTPFLDLKIFQEIPKLRVMDDESPRFGLTKILFNQRPFELEVSYDSAGQEIYQEFLLDTLRLWYQQDVEANWNIYLQQDTLFKDTVYVEVPSKSEFLNTARLQLERRQAANSATTFNPGKQIAIAFNHPLKAIDTSKIHLYADTLRKLIKPQINIDSTNRRNLLVRYAWKEGLPYELELLPAALTDWFGIQNDTILRSYKADLFKKFGIINLNVTNLDEEQHYLIRVLSSKNEVVGEFRPFGSAEFSQQLRFLPAGKYSVEVINDQNNNGRWDTGNYDKKLQPEAIQITELEELRSNWELDAQIQM